MLNKTPKKFWLKFGLKLGAAGIALELLALGGSYVFWRKLNTSGGEKYKKLNINHFINYTFSQNFVNIAVKSIQQFWKDITKLVKFLIPIIFKR